MVLWWNSLTHTFTKMKKGIETSLPSPPPLFCVSHYRKFQIAACLDWVWNKPLIPLCVLSSLWMLPFTLVYQNNTLHTRENTLETRQPDALFCAGTGEYSRSLFMFFSFPTSFKRHHRYRIHRYTSVDFSLFLYIILKWRWTHSCRKRLSPIHSSSEGGSGLFIFTQSLHAFKSFLTSYLKVHLSIVISTYYYSAQNLKI